MKASLKITHAQQKKTVLAGKQLHTTMQDLLLLKFGSLEADLHGP